MHLSLGNAIGAYSIDRWGAVRTLVPCVAVVGLAFLTLSLEATMFLTVVVAIVMWSIAGTTILPAQQHRLIALAPEGPGVVLSLNSSAIYPGSAAGAGLGGLMLRFAPLTMLGWIGSGWELIALVVLFWSVWLINRVVQRSGRQEYEDERCAVGQIVEAQRSLNSSASSIPRIDWAARGTGPPVPLVLTSAF